MTKYDRKVLAREAAARREKKKRILGIISTAAIIVCIIALIVVVPMVKNRKVLKEYIKVGDVSVSQLEFNYHRANTINSYSQILPYFGVDTSKPLSEQVYDSETGATWADFFNEQAALSIQENRAMVDDAAAKKVSLDVDNEYNTYMNQIKTEAKEAGMSLNSYFVSLFGTGASEKTMKDIIKNDITAILYYQYLTQTMEASDEEAQAEYEENKDDYDSVDYRVLEFAADVTDESAEEEITSAMDAMTARAQEMLDKVNAGEDFETLCATYAPEEERTEYADSETDKSLVTGATASSSYVPYMDWLFDASRKDGDTTLFTDEDDYTCYVLSFEKRYMGDTVLSNIKQTLTNSAVTEYVNTLSANYEISDPHGNLPAMEQ